MVIVLISRNIVMANYRHRTTSVSVLITTNSSECPIIYAGMLSIRKNAHG